MCDFLQFDDEQHDSKKLSVMLSDKKISLPKQRDFSVSFKTDYSVFTFALDFFFLALAFFLALSLAFTSALPPNFSVFLP